ncbi:MAG: hypothetical protein ACD_7C00154G0013 [uncultured bacterium]|nr:MAG: hypothetical protein ACD_7C00154G0013 [uncultured bacterium]HBR79355.1 peptide-methionine (S)-S-oxide reductase [Candidatus Moranbacteria bacterium]
MNKGDKLKILGGLILVASIFLIVVLRSNLFINNNSMKNITIPINAKTAVFAGGCFWCVEADFEKLQGIFKVTSGYSGGESENPTYENYAEGGHREVVEVTYYPKKTTYKNLVEHIILYTDPTDANGSFGDRGVQYSPAIYYENKEEKNIAQAVIDEIDAKKIYDKPLDVEILPRKKFWAAEEYHQDYYKKNNVRYKLYRSASGRNSFIEKHQGKAREKNFFQGDEVPF